MISKIEKCTGKHENSQSKKQATANIYQPTRAVNKRVELSVKWRSIWGNLMPKTIVMSDFSFNSRKNNGRL